MNRYLWTITLLTLLATTTANAEYRNEGMNTYLGLQFGVATDGDDEDLDYGMLRLGLVTTENTTLEIRTGEGTDDQVIDGIRIGIERIYGLYGSRHFRIAEKTSVYATLGWTEITVKGSIPGRSVQVDENGLSYGIGVEAYGINLEWMQYLDTSDLEVDAIAIGYNYHFD